jgi:hypothetical protein
MNEPRVAYIILGGAIAAVTGVLSQVIGQFLHRSNRRSETRRTKAEALALALVDIKHATGALLEDPERHYIDEALKDTNSIRQVEVLARLYFPEIDISEFLNSSRDAIVSGRRVAGPEVNEEDWPFFTSSVSRFRNATDQVLNRLADIVEREVGKPWRGA